MIIRELNQKVILPLFEILELSQEDKTVLLNSLHQLFFIKTIPKIFSCLTHEEVLDLQNKLGGCKTIEEKLVIVDNFISRSGEINRTLQNYSQETLIPLITRLIENFASNATTQQKTNLLSKLS